MKILCLFALVVSALSHDTIPKHQEVIVTKHIPAEVTGSLGLNLMDMRQFSGHAFNIIRHRCPNVNKEQLHSIQKYITKRIHSKFETSKSTPSSSRNMEFRKLIDTMTTCARVPVTPKNDKMDHVPLSDDLIMPFSTFKQTYEKMKKQQEKSEQTPEPKLPILDTIVPSSLRTPEEKQPTDDEIHVIEFSFAVPSTSSGNPETAELNPMNADEVDVKEIKPTQENGGLYNWISSIWASITGFMSRMFGYSTRSRRSAIDDDDNPFEPIVSVEELPPVVVSLDAVEPGVSRLSQEQEPPKMSKGKEAFTQLIDEMCRLYCDACPIVQAYDFKLAARELLTFLFEDSKGVELAGSHYFNQEFLDSIAACENHIKLE